MSSWPACENNQCQYHDVGIPVRDLPFFEILLDAPADANAYEKAVISRNRYVRMYKGQILSENYFCPECLIAAMQTPVIKLAGILGRLRMPLHDEKAAQRELEEHLERHGVPFQREVRLSNEDIVDFMVGGIAIELKVKGSRSAALRQIERYALHPDVTGVILLTNRSCLLPSVIHGKPALAVSMGGAWL